ncbi:uncharacterized protein LOC142357164, partial [Convolutriloba macropyga]|uniref:uncharacterized protein LOC142357164 n=1 Tax=Convolutriloba macropyga TaxID=536237 RepID=UPI003F51B182
MASNMDYESPYKSDSPFSYEVEDGELSCESGRSSPGTIRDCASECGTQTESNMITDNEKVTTFRVELENNQEHVQTPQEIARKINNKFGPAVIPATATTSAPNVETDDVANLTGVAYYVNENSDSSKFTFTLSSAATQIRIVTNILDSRNESTGEAQFTEYIHNVTVSETTFEIDLLEYNGEKLDRPCTMILGNLFTDAPDSNFSQFTAFTGGYTIDPAENFSWPENFVEDGNETEYTTLPRHSVIVGLATGGEVCNLDFIGKTYSVGMKEGVLIADGVWLGPDQGQTSPIQFASSQFVSS